MGLMADGLEFVADALIDAAGLSGGVTISRGDDSTTEVPCVRGWRQADRTQPESVGPLRTTAAPYEYLIPIKSYEFNGCPADPQIGDRITDPLGVFEVLSAGGKPFVDKRPDGMWRIRTKRLDTE